MNDRRVGRRAVLWWAAGMALASPQAALAHTGTGLGGGLLSGALHPLSGPDHMLAMVAVGIWGAFLGRPLLVLLPVIFPAFMACGGLLGIWNLPFPPVELGIALSVVVLGGLVAGAIRLPAAAAAAVVAMFGLFHGYAHGAELPSAADPAGYSLGFIVATGLLHVVGITLGLARKTSWGDRALRGAGALTVVIGLGFLGQAVLA